MQKTCPACGGSGLGPLFVDRPKQNRIVSPPVLSPDHHFNSVVAFVVLGVFILVGTVATVFIILSENRTAQAAAKKDIPNQDPLRVERPQVQEQPKRQPEPEPVVIAVPAKGRDQKKRVAEPPDLRNAPIVEIPREQPAPKPNVLPMAKKTDKPPAPMRSGPFQENFRSAKLGGLPADWSGDPSVAVRRSGQSSWLQNGADGVHGVWTPTLDFSSRFQLEAYASLDAIARLEITFEGWGTTPDLRAVFATAVVNPRLWDVTLLGTTEKWVKVDPNRNKIRLVRDGEIVQLFVNDKNTHAQRLASDAHFTRIGVHLRGPAKNSQGHGTVARLYSLSFTPLGQ